MNYNYFFGILHALVASGVAFKMWKKGLKMEAIWVYIIGLNWATYTFTH